VLDCVFVSQPLTALPSQLPKPAVQLVNPHAPPTHAAPFVFAGTGHALPHAPQLVTDVASRASQPLALIMSQLA
jgi:hypothetical protein